MALSDQALQTIATGFAFLRGSVNCLFEMVQECGAIERQIETQKAHF